MAVTLIIKNCAECPYMKLSWFTGVPGCRKADRELPYTPVPHMTVGVRGGSYTEKKLSDEIPEWCPLAEASKVR